MVTERSPWPAVAEAGDGEPVMAGGAATVNAEEPEATPSAVTTVIAAEPAVVRLAGGMVAVQEVVSPQVFVPVISVAVPELNDQ
jgi:hypothetical protein